MKSKTTLFASVAAILVTAFVWAFRAAGPELPIKEKPVAQQGGATLSRTTAPAGNPVASGASTPGAGGAAMSKDAAANGITPAGIIPPSLPPRAVSPVPADAEQKKAFMESIESASITYDPVNLPKIQPFLSNPDAEVRAAALNGIVNLGDRAGAPILREAAKQAATPEEAIELMRMAAYLELPSAPIMKRKKSGTAPATVKRMPFPGMRPTGTPPPAAGTPPAAKAP